MLGDKDAVTNLAVKDLKQARSFYEGTLGLTPMETQGDELVAYKSGHSTIYVYRSNFAGTNQATAMTWATDASVEDEVRALKAKGVRFEHYDMSGQKALGDVYDEGGFKIAWFKDPDGNVLAITGK